MCKILTVAGVKPEKSQELQEFLETASVYLSLQDQDALGYAAISRSKGLFGERWIYPHHAFERRNPFADVTPAVASATGGAVVKQRVYNAFGAAATGEAGALADVCAVTMHARFATCGGGIENAHPFVEGETSLIHNGIVETAGLKQVYSTCDSEVILHEYIKHNVADEPVNIQAVADRLFGWYACAVLTKIQDRWMMDLFRESQAELHACYVQQLDTVVFCTKPSIVEEICKDLKWQHSPFHELEPGVLVRIDCETGEGVLQESFNPDLVGGSWTRTWNGYATASRITTGEDPEDADDFEFDSGSGTIRRIDRGFGRRNE